MGMIYTTKLSWDKLLIIRVFLNQYHVPQRLKQQDVRALMSQANDGMLQFFMNEIPLLSFSLYSRNLNYNSCLCCHNPSQILFLTCNGAGHPTLWLHRCSSVPWFTGPPMTRARRSHSIRCWLDHDVIVWRGGTRHVSEAALWYKGTHAEQESEDSADPVCFWSKCGDLVYPVAVMIQRLRTLSIKRSFRI